MDVESLGDISVSSSVERQAMREQLDAVRQTLNTLASGAQPGGSGISGVAPTGFDGVLSEIASKLSSIESLYSNLTNKLDKVDLRVEDSERHIKDLQHFSASTIHETARLVDYVGGRATPNTRAGSVAGTAPAGPSSSTALRARHMAAAAGVPSTPPPPPPNASPMRTPMASLEYVPGHMGATIQQHAAQIHKLIAGLDFLEAHIIRQDQVVEGLQKSVATVAATHSAALESRSPSELSLRLHDLAELVAKLRAHVYKVEKKSGSHEQSLGQLSERVKALELAEEDRAGGSSSSSGGEGGAQPQSAGPSSAELAAAQDDLRSMVLGLGQDVDQLRDQVQAQQQQQEQLAAAAAVPPQPGLAADEGAEMRRQLAYLMSQVPTLVMENAELRQFAARTTQQLADLNDKHHQMQLDHEQRLQQLQAAAAAAAAVPPPLAAEAEAAPHVAVVEQLGATVAALQDQVAGLEAVVQDMPAREEVLQAEERAAAAAAAAVEGLGATVAALEERVASFDARVSQVAQSLQERAEPSAGVAMDLKAGGGDESAANGLEGVDGAAATSSGPAEGDEEVPASDAAAGEEDAPTVVVATAVAVVEDVAGRRLSSSSGNDKFVGPVPVDDPAAAVLAAEVAAAARANLEEQFGQMRHRLDLAAESAAAAEEASRSSAESAAAAVAAAEAAAAAAAEQRDATASISSASAAALAALQESVLAMVAGMEQEQAALKEQLAQLAAQVSQEQGAISSGLQAVQEQVAAAASAATEAAACAQLVQEQQAANEAQERQAAEALQAVQAELREQVAAVMEQLKERVELGVQQMDAQVAALSDQLSGALRADQLDAALQDVRSAVADAAERSDLISASLEELRSELILLTGQQDVLLSRLDVLEAAVGIDLRASRSQPHGSGAAAAAAAALDDEAAQGLEGVNGTEGASSGEEEGKVQEMEGAAATRLRDGAGSSSRELLLPGAGPSGGLLELVAELRARVGGLEGTLEAAAADMDQVRNQLVDNAQEADDKIQQATSQLLANIEGLSAAVVDMDGRLASTAAGCEAVAAAAQQQASEQAVTTSALAARLEEMQVLLEAEVVARVQETAAAVSSLSARLARDYINREQLGAIFQARADMKRAVDELATVFDTGRLLRTASHEDATAAAAAALPSPPGGSGTLSPRLVSALEDLAGKQAELEHQVKLALYRTEGAVRQEELRGVQHAMMALEMQFKKLGVPGPAGGSAAGPGLTGAAAAAAAPAAAGGSGAAAPPAAVAVAEVRSSASSEERLAEIFARVEALEALLAAQLAGGAAAAASGSASGEAQDTEDAAAAAEQAADGEEDGARDAISGPELDVQLQLTPGDAADLDSPVKVRLLIRRGEAEAEREDGLLAAQPAGEAAAESAGGPLEEAAAEPSLSQMLLLRSGSAGASGTPSSSSSPTKAEAGTGLAAAAAADEQLRLAVRDLAKLAEALQAELAGAAAERQRLAEAIAGEAADRARLAESLEADLAMESAERRRMAEALAGELAVEAGERHRLSEGLAELQERLDSQVNATASTAAMLATMATDQHQQQQQVRLTLRVGGPEAEDLASLAAAMSTLTTRVDAAEEALASAFVVRTPRSPSRPTAVPPPMLGSAAAGSADAAADDTAAGGAEALSGEEAGAAEGRALTSAQEGASEVREEGEEPGAVEEEEEEDVEVLRPALGLMVPVVPREVEQQLAALADQVTALAATVGSLGSRVEGLEAADALEDVRAAASQVVLEAIPGMVAQQVGIVRQEMEALVAQQGEPLVEMAGQAARDAAEAVLAVREAAAEAEAARQAVEHAAREAGESATAAQAAAADAAECKSAAADVIQAATLEAAVAAAREAAAEVARDAAAEVAGRVVSEHVAVHAASYDEERAAQLAAEVKEARLAVAALGERLSDVDSMRDQLDALVAQVRDMADVPNMTSAASSQPPSTPTAAAVASIFTPAPTALVMQPAPPASLTPRTGASPAASTGGGAAGGGRATPGQIAAQTSSQQVAFLARMVAAVKGYSNRLHSQYSDAEETGMALSQVDSSLEEVSARFADVRDPTSPAFAEALVMILEQVAALRYIGSQTHPAIQQMVLEHENRLDLLTEQLREGGAAAGAGGDASAAAAAAEAAVASVSGRVAVLEAEVGRTAAQQAVLDRAVTEILAAAEGLRQRAPGAAAAVAAAKPTADGDGTGIASGGEAAAAADEAVAEAAAAEAVGLTALAAKVRLLDETLASRLEVLRQGVLEEARAAASSTVDLGAVDAKVEKLHGSCAVIRNRVLSLQEYLENTQGMVKDVQVGLGGLHRRVDALEGPGGSAGGAGSGRVSVTGGGGAAGSDPASLRELKTDLAKLESRLLTLEAASLDAAHSLAGLKGLAPRVTDAEGRLTDACAKLAAVLGGGGSAAASAAGASAAALAAIPAPGAGMSLPSVAGSLRALERRVAGRLESAFLALDSLAVALAAAGRIQAESTANPFKAISAAVKNPVVVAMEEKMESMRATLEVAVNNLLDDLRRDQQQQAFESRLGGAAEGGSVRGSTEGPRSMSLRF